MIQPVVLSDNPAGEWGVRAADRVGLGITTQQHTSPAAIQIMWMHTRVKDNVREKIASTCHRMQGKAMLRDANYSEKEMKEAMRRKKWARLSRSANNLILRINLFDNVSQKIRNGVQSKKLKRARKNLLKLKASGVFHEHSDIYDGWWVPI